MKYPRPAYKDQSVKYTHVISPFTSAEFDVPRFDYPISAIENFRRNLARNNPLWCTNSASDVQSMGAQDVVTKEVRGTIIHTDFRKKATEDYTFVDWFNTQWTWVCSAHGAMLTPGTQLLADITDWETDLVWPNLEEWDFEETAERYMKTEYDPEKALLYDIGRGCTERLITLVGGYTEGMLAMATEPEAIKAFLDRYADFEIQLFDKINSLYPLDLVNYHDDWGTELDTFFSEKMLLDIVFEPTKKIIDHIHSKDVYFMLHSCGNITRFVPYMIDMEVDMLQIQRRAVDIPALKRKYGDKIGFNAGIEGMSFGVDNDLSKEELIKLIRESVDLYGPNGGYLTSVSVGDPEKLWDSHAELYAYSREFYDAEQGRP